MAHIRVSGNVPGPGAWADIQASRDQTAVEYATDYAHPDMAPASKFSTTSLSYPINVEGDSQLGHYIMFFINKNVHLSYLTDSILLKNTIKVNIFNTVINIQPL